MTMADETILGAANIDTDGAADETTQTPQGEQTPPAAEEVTYDFKEVAGESYDEARATAFAELMKAQNIAPETANEIAKYGLAYANEAVAAIQQQQIETAKGWETQTRETLGKDFDNTLQKCGVAIERLEKDIPNLREVLNESGIGNRVELVKAFSLLGELLSEDGGHGTNGAAVSQKSIYNNTDFSKY